MRWPGGELLDQRRPVFARNGPASQLFGKHRLICKLWCEERRKNQVVLVVLELWEPFLQERSDGVPIDTVGSVEVFNDLVCEFPGAFEFGDDGFDQLKHFISICCQSRTAKRNSRAPPKVIVWLPS